MIRSRKYLGRPLPPLNGFASNPNEEIDEVLSSSSDESVPISRPIKELNHEAENLNNVRFFHLKKFTFF